MIEFEAALSFDNVRKGSRVQVDIHDPRVVALVAAGYYKIIWKEPHGLLDSTTSVSGIPGPDLGSSAAVTEEEVDGGHHPEPAVGAVGGTADDAAVGEADDPADPDRVETPSP